MTVLFILGKDLKQPRALCVGTWMRSLETRPGNSKFLTWLCLLVSTVPRAVALWMLSKALKSTIIFPTAAVKRLCNLMAQQAHFRAADITLEKPAQRDLCAHEVCMCLAHSSQVMWIQKLK